MRNLVRLGDICSFQNGRAFKKAEWSESGLPIIRIQNLNRTSAAFNYFSGEYDKRIEVSDGDLLFSWSGTVGSSFGPHLWSRGKGLLNQHIFRVSLGGSIDKRYAYYALLEITSEIEKSVSGAVGLVHVTQGKLKGFTIPLPPLPEQQRIVAILDEAFAGISTAVANTEKNLANARELFRSSLAICFSQYSQLPHRLTARLLADDPADASGGLLSDGSILAAKSSTRGRAETDRVIEGELSLSVGMPSIQPRRGWRWTKLTNIARLESGHTPSRKKPEYWGGDIPWLGITDARAYHGRVIEDTEQHTNKLGIDNSAARILPAGTVCLSRTASVGYVVITGAAMATSQDFVNWVCSSELEPHFLKYLLHSEWRDFSRFSSGSVHQTIYFPEVKAFHICHPCIKEQKRIVGFLDEMRANSASLESIYQQKLNALNELKQSLLQKAFSGELSTTPQDEIETALA